MGQKYEFTDETINCDGHILHRIKRLSDGKLGGWIESEENLSQDGNCWVDDEAKVCGNARVYGNAKVYDDAKIYSNAKVYGNAQVYGYAKVWDNAQVYGNAEVYQDARIYDNAKVYGYAKVVGSGYSAAIFDNAEVYGNAIVSGDAIVSDDMHISSGHYTECGYIERGYYEDESSNNSLNEIVQDFIYKVDDSNKLKIQTEYNSIDEFFNESVTNDIKSDTLIICAIDTKEPLIKLQKVNIEDKTEFKFIVDITNEDGDDFRFRSIIKSQEQLNQLVQQTIDMLNQSSQFIKYANDLENYFK